jgi:hypothetical protein
MPPEVKLKLFDALRQGRMSGLLEWDSEVQPACADETHAVLGAGGRRLGKLKALFANSSKYQVKSDHQTCP